MAQKKKKKTGTVKAMSPASASQNKPKNKKLIIITVAAIALLAIIAGTVIGVIVGFRNVNYLKGNLSKFISLSEEDYKNFPVESPLREYTEGDLERAITAIIVKNKNKTALYNSNDTRNIPLTLGDVVKIYYRGYTVDENGREVDFEGGSNFSLPEPSQLELGSGSFVPGFEEALLGKMPKETPEFKLVTTGEVLDGDVIYMTYVAAYPDGKSKVVTDERINLADPDIDKIYGEGFKNYIIGWTSELGTSAPQKIGESIKGRAFPYDENGDVAYADMRISRVTRFENLDNVLTVEVTFPVDYSETSLRGKKAFFDVYMDTAKIYDTPELTDSFITETLKISAETLAEYEGATLIEKYRSYVKDTEVIPAIKKANNALIEEAMWKHYKEKTTVKRLPKNEVNSFYDDIYAELEAFYQENGETYGDLDSTAVVYFGLEANADWRAHATSIAEDAVTEKIIFYYVARREGFILKGEALDSEIEREYNEHLEYYMEYHKEKFEGLTDKEYQEKLISLKSYLNSYYGEKYFEECAIYAYGIEKIIEFADVK